MKLIIHTDGGSRGNPGAAAIGVVIEQELETKKKHIAAFGKTIGETTNNVAEYSGIVEALTWLLNNPIPGFSHTSSIHFYLDSTLVVNQLNGLFKVKDQKMRELLLTVRQLEQEVGGSIRYQAVPRAQNAQADILVNEALDKEA